jgi:hypothetical protein
MENSKENRGAAGEPSRGNPGNSQPETKDNRPIPEEGSFRNVETEADNPSAFDDSYASQVEDEIADDEARSEKEDSQ